MATYDQKDGVVFVDVGDHIRSIGKKLREGKLKVLHKPHSGTVIDGECSIIEDKLKLENQSGREGQS